jgi:hypothetical protein
VSSTVIGTLAWAERSKGLLSNGERAEILLRAVPLQLRDWGGALLRSVGLGRRPLTFDADFVPPDSAIAREAEALCRDVSPRYLTHHCLRTYWWGAILAELDGIQFDHELLYVAAVLHDLGVTEHAPSTDAQPCFAIAGALAARKFLLERGVDTPRATAVAEAIGQHCNLWVPASAGPEATLLREGAALDVVGLRYRELSPQAVARLLARYPRENFKREFSVRWQKEADERPGTRAHFLVSSLRFMGRVRHSPFDE